MLFKLIALGKLKNGGLKVDTCIYPHPCNLSEYDLLVKARDTVERETGLSLLMLKIEGSLGYVQFMGDETYYNEK